MDTRERVAIIGSGNWGSAIARVIGFNTARHSSVFDPLVRMWVYEELVDGVPLTEIINTTHVNVRYLPGITLPDNVRAEPRLEEAVRGATLLVFVLPHQFLGRTFTAIRETLGLGGHGHTRVRAISLIKGVATRTDESTGRRRMSLISDDIRARLCVDVCVLMGANVAGEVAEEQLCEATIGYSEDGEAHAEVWRRLFETHYFRIGLTRDSPTVELCGALKNVVALAAGFCDGLGLGGNTKAALMRIGLREMQSFCREFYGCGVCETFFESCGVADLITTCYGGRNRKVAEAFVRTGKPWDVLERDMLDGQKLQGTLTAVDVWEMLSHARSVARYPLFAVTYRIMAGELPPADLVRLYELAAAAESAK